MCLWCGCVLAVISTDNWLVGVCNFNDFNGMAFNDTGLLIKISFYE